MKHYYKKFSVLACLLFVLGFCATSITAQTTITTNFANNNGFAIVTFNFTNNNAGPVMITDISSVCTLTGVTNVAAYYKASAINGAPGPISTANGWTQFGNGTINATTNVQPFLSCLSLVIPAGATYGLCVQAKDATDVGNLSYSTLTAGTYNFPGGGCILTTGNNIGYAGDIVPAPPTFTPRGFIGSITFITSAGCAGTPVPGNTMSTASTICPTLPFTLSLSNCIQVSGITHQWQSSPDGIVWTNIAGASSSTLTTTQNADTYYRDSLNCTNSGLSASSAPVHVALTPASNCYCIPGITDCTLDDEILNVQFGGINNSSSGCSGNGYTNYSGSVAAGTGYSGGGNPMSVDVGPGGTEYVNVWIDYNHNGTFDPSEYTLLGTGNGSTVTGTVVIPATALGGTTRMRIRVRYNQALTPADACIAYGFGETEDYAVNIVPCVQGVINTDPADATTSCGNDASFSVDATGTFLTYQWEQRISPTDPWTNVPGATSSTLTISAPSESMSGYQYRAIISGTCTAIIASGVATLTVTPYLPPVSPVPAIICSGGSLQLFASPPPSVTNVSSGPLSIAVPDNSATGAATTLNVSGIPAGAVITNMSVTINMTHTYCGDMLFNLKAPNGNILALDKYLTATANQAGAYPNIGFVNTVIGSAGVNALSSATSQPITGLFKPDAINGPITGPTVQNPAGYPSNAAGYSDLYSQPDGVWTLAMADGGLGDIGTLTSWSISITWGVAPATAIFSDTNHLFLDAGLTLPYHPGMSVNSVYTNTSVDTTYSAVVTNGTCTATIDIPVTVAHTLTAIVSPGNQSGCIDGSVSLTTSATGGPFNTRWEESTDGGTTWSPVSNGGVYSGAGTNTLTVGPLPDTYDGYQYRAILDIPSCGTSDTTAVSTLAVHPNPNVTIAAPVKLLPGLTTTLSVSSVTPNPAATYQWYRDGILIPGATGSTIDVDVDGFGDYYATVNDVNGCNGVSNTVTVSDSVNNDILFIYPNPNAGQFQVRYYSLPGNTLVRGVSVYDSKGARVYFKSYGINVPYGRIDVDLSNMGSGVYMVELVDFTGKRIKTGRVIVQ